ncbi:hypothetical protein I4U23_012055 [Adineta vaga]|nr:hypothetical protein I4U23_012055 [Adineta vaga]
MGLRRAIVSPIYYIYRRFTSPNRTSQYWAILILIALIYITIFIYIHERVTSSEFDSFTNKDSVDNQTTSLLEYQKQEHPKSVFNSSNKTNLQNQSFIFNTSQVRLRYSFIDLDDLDVDINILDEEFQPTTNISINLPPPGSHQFSRILNIKGDLSTIVYNRIPQLWINLVRDPIARIAAEFNATREICRTTNRCFVSKQTINDTLRTCIAKYPPRDCISTKNGISKMIPFFCGLTHTHECERNASFALQQAKQNVEYYYTVIGITEEFYKFLYVLEKLFPEYFQLARLLFMNTRNPDHLIDERDTNFSSPNDQIIRTLRPLLNH